MIKTIYDVCSKEIQGDAKSYAICQRSVLYRILTSMPDREYLCSECVEAIEKILYHRKG